MARALPVTERSPICARDSWSSQTDQERDGKRPERKGVGVGGGLLPPRHPLARKRAISVGDLESEPFIVMEDGHSLGTLNSFRVTSSGALQPVGLATGDITASATGLAAQ
jgi:hypothetical protein